jgi:LPS-assembly lipoprotein
MSSSKRLSNTILPETIQSAIEQPASLPVDLSLSRRSALGWGIAGLGSLLLSACGFRPMYGDPAVTSSAGGATSAKLAAVQIDSIDDRVGQKLHNLLRDRMNPGGQPDKPAYRLAVTLDEESTTIASGNDNTRHNDLTVTATYWLSQSSESEDKSYLMSNTNSRITVSYDTLDDPYTDLVARQDAEQRAIEQLADMITTRVGAYFANHAA